MWHKAAQLHPMARLTLLILMAALVLLPWADLNLYQVEPGAELGRMMQGLVSPSLSEIDTLTHASLITVAFALIGVGIAALLGMPLALLFHFRVIRGLCAFIRAIHELFWALIFMQVFGLSAITGLLAITLPYACTFAKVYAEILEGIDNQTPLPSGTDKISRWCYSTIPAAWSALVAYTRYRFECALRSSAILGFIGLPTLGFHLDTAFAQGVYDQAATILLLFFALIATLRFWLKPALVPVYLVVCLWALPETPPVYGSYFWQFFTQDIWPKALLLGDWIGALNWYANQLVSVAMPAVGQTLVLTQLSLAATCLLTVALAWLGSRQFGNPISQTLGHGILLALRSTPEMILAFVFLLLFGPSMLPAILALALHNSGLISYLGSRITDHVKLRQDAPKGIDRYSYEILPRIYPQLMTFLLYRWEVIMRESAILGILGITTLGFYIDSAFEDIRFDRAALLIVISALLNVLVDSLARRLRRRAGLRELRMG
ncbi:PhnE/PtxC family ABC transporter permease [Corallincola platygyrae]|uniref:PhnE/PtxC family ABC transporter permease n=1 Tax=Corallincola platygyrae TaxID=1193278 RepID=A0ABW4XR84_9GAMM